jgi:hypothetical protein
LSCARACSETAAHALRQGVADDDLTDADDILVPADHERHDLSQARDREAALLLLEFELLERDDVARPLLARAEDDAVRALFDVVQPIVLVDRATRHQWRVSRSPCWDVD